MPLYICNAAKDVIDASRKAAIAAEVTRIHCEVTAAPPTFVHVFFFEDAPFWPLNGQAVLLAGTIRGGRTDVQKRALMERMRGAIHEASDAAPEAIAVRIADTPASWVMEGGDLLPEPGEEAEWLAAHEAKLGAARCR